jgi:hypothetical protein
MQPDRIVREPSSATPSKRRRAPPVVSIDRVAGLVWRRPDYPVLSAGRYTVRAVRFQGPEWVRSFHRWSLRLEFALVHEPISVSAFFNFGNDPNGCRIGRQSRFYKAWVIANGEHPRKGQQMTPEVFLDGQFFEVEVESSRCDADGETKHEAEVYSKVTRILSVSRP